ncbi:MAG: hypothetical protein U0941_17780 [Planctomycetaceae bacterium]
MDIEQVYALAKSLIETFDGEDIPANQLVMIGNIIARVGMDRLCGDETTIFDEVPE